MEFTRLGGLQHAVEVGPQGVRPGVVLVAVDLVNIPAPLHGVANQQGLLVLDALRLTFKFFLILLTQPDIDCTKNLLHLPQGVTARFYSTLGAVTGQGII